MFVIISILFIWFRGNCFSFLYKLNDLSVEFNFFAEDWLTFELFVFYSNDYNSTIIKINLFFLSFAIYFVVNALFFDDKTMHNIYITGGSYDFLYQIPKIIYSSLISTIVNIILKSYLYQS